MHKSILLFAFTLSGGRSKLLVSSATFVSRPFFQRQRCRSLHSGPTSQSICKSTHVSSKISAKASGQQSHFCTLNSQEDHGPSLSTIYLPDTIDYNKMIKIHGCNITALDAGNQKLVSDLVLLAIVGIDIATRIKDVRNSLEDSVESTDQGESVYCTTALEDNHLVTALEEAKMADTIHGVFSYQSNHAWNHVDNIYNYTQELQMPEHHNAKRERLREIKLICNFLKTTLEEIGTKCIELL